MRRLWERIKTPAYVVAGVAIFALVLSQNVAPLEAGVRAPGFEVETDEGPLRLSEGGVTVVNFWGRYCPPCRREAPVLSRAHERLQRRGGRVVGVSTDGATLDEAVAAARRLGMHYPIAVPSGDLLARYKVDRLPTTYVVAPDGRIAASFVGAVTDRELDRAIRTARR